MTDRLDLWSKAKEFLMRRRTYYVRTFDFSNVNNQSVLADLAKFCRANKSTFDENDRVSLILQGRQEVWLRIQHHLRLSPEQLWELYSGIKE